MLAIFNAILYQPIYNVFVALYNVIPDVGIVIVVITAVLKLALYPSSKQSILAQKSMQELQPKLEELKKKHKDDQQALAQETMKLYKEHKVNPLGSCLPLLVQIPVFIALYLVFRDGLTTNDFSQLYSFIAAPESINPYTLGLFDLSKPSYVLALFAGAAQYWQARSLSRRRAPKTAGKGGKDENMMAVMNKQMLYVMPIITIFIGSTFPGGVALYWFLSTLMTAVQQHFLFRDSDDKKPKDGVIEGKIVE